MDLRLDEIFLVANKATQSSLLVETKIEKIKIDSRKINKGDLFVSLKGEKFDGHNFLGNAFDNGAVAAIVEEEVDFEHKSKIIKVESSLDFLQEIAYFYRKKFDAKVIGITGSVGKSTVKEMMASVFETELEVLKTKENLNGQIGLPLTILDLGSETQIAVLEIGISKIGEMEKLARIARPDFAVITNIGVSHLENFKSTEVTCREKLKIANDKNCKIYINGDDLELSKNSNILENEIIYFGLNGNFPYRAENIYFIGNETEFVLVTENFRENMKIPCLGIHNVYNALSVISLAIDFGIHLEDIKMGISNFKSLKMRQKITHFKNFILIDDTYNSSPDSIKASVTLLQSIKTEGKRIVVMADILELGSSSKDIHFEIGKYIALSGVEVLITTGNFSKFMCEGAASSGTRIEILHCKNNIDVSKEVISRISNGDKILVKGSRGMKTEEIVKIIRESSEDPKKFI